MAAGALLKHGDEVKSQNRVSSKAIQSRGWRTCRPGADLGARAGQTFSRLANPGTEVGGAEPRPATNQLTSLDTATPAPR
ncbi:hypothetical protein OPT61_g10516 [Boeremia exigua]|uniref:Uncharacterized protein n=1 Tax=Boeremia exigua TaxID=749465 RepID=A0ACC2HQR7_9PLEO|nr:hypothetical protein OPT61_g10516 [Boeremia exigua]